MKELSDGEYANVVEALKENIELRKDLEDFKDMCLQFLKVIGFGDGTCIYPELLLPEDDPNHKSPMNVMIRAMGDYAQLAISAKFSKQAEKKLEEKFAFIAKYTPLIMKYGTTK